VAIFIWAKEDLLKYVNREKASAFVNQLRSQFPQKWHGDVEAYTDIVKIPKDSALCALSLQLRAQQKTKPLPINIQKVWKKSKIFQKKYTKSHQKTVETKPRGTGAWQKYLFLSYEQN